MAIIHHKNGSVLAEDKNKTLREMILSKRYDLRGACFSGTDFGFEDMRGADFSGAYLSKAGFSKAYLHGANFSHAYLSGANFNGSNLSDAEFQGAHLSCANFSGAILCGVDLRKADLSAIKTDLFSVLDLARGEVPFLLGKVLSGEINGSVYTGVCACLVGTIANSIGCDSSSVPGIKPDPRRPAERWFLGIKKGDTPENSQIAAITAEWVNEWLVSWARHLKPFCHKKLILFKTNRRRHREKVF